MSKYQHWYNSLINNARQRNSSREGHERHHILPRSLGGSNTDDNLVNLTLKEHYIAHLLLTKLYTGQEKYKMTWALVTLSSKPSNKKRLTSRQFVKARQMLSASMKGVPKSAEHRKKIGDAVRGERNGMWGKRGELSPRYQATVSEETRNKISKSNKKWAKENPHPFKGKHHSEESKKKISQSKIGTKLSVDHIEKIRQRQIGSTKTKETKQKIKKSMCKHTYKIFCPDGTTVITNNLREFCKEHDLDQGNLSRVLRKERNYNQHKGYTGEIMS
jgi:hypothetical protein